MVILSVDYGDVRTGIAVCDKSEFLASPVCVITERNTDKEDIETVQAIVRALKAAGAVAHSSCGIHVHIGLRTRK